MTVGSGSWLLLFTVLRLVVELQADGTAERPLGLGAMQWVGRLRSMVDQLTY